MIWIAPGHAKDHDRRWPHRLLGRSSIRCWRAGGAADTIPIRRERHAGDAVEEGRAMRARRMLVMSVAVAGWLAAAQAEPLVPNEAAKHVGETATVCGLVAGAKFAAQVR